MFILCHLGNHCSSAPLRGSTCGYIAVLLVARGLTDGTRTAFDARSDSNRLRMERIQRGTFERPMRLIFYYIPTTVSADMAIYACTLEALGTSQSHSTIGIVRVQVLDKCPHGASDPTALCEKWSSNGEHRHLVKRRICEACLHTSFFLVVLALFSARVDIYLWATPRNPERKFSEPKPSRWTHPVTA